MPLARSRDYLSIGEVLDAVRPDFPDVSISKIRFLESEGLLEPERTSSGYRKFYAKDVDRLRYILTLQRDHFMPLKVIRDRIEGGHVELPANGSAPPASQPAPPAPARAPRPAPAMDVGDVQLDRAELLSASGLTEAELAGLEDFGIVSKSAPYDGNDLLVAKSAKGFLTLGIEARHLRMYRQFAERETGFFEQLLMPEMQRKDADASRRTAEALRRLEALSRTMREGMLRSSLQELL